MTHQKSQISEILFNTLIMSAFVLFIAVFLNNNTESSDISVNHSSIETDFIAEIDVLPVEPPKIPYFDEARIVSEIIGLALIGNHNISLLISNQSENVKYRVCCTVYHDIRQKDIKKVSLYYDFSPDADVYPSIS